MLPALILGSLVFLGGPPKAKTNDCDDCYRRIAKAQWQLHEAVEYYGDGSRQARHALNIRHDRRQPTRRLRTYQFLCLDRHFGQSLNTRPVLPQSVLHDAEVETWYYDIIPVVSNSA
jgi:hypothetical protein